MLFVREDLAGIDIVKEVVLEACDIGHFILVSGLDLIFIPDVLIPDVRPVRKPEYAIDAYIFVAGS
jgi:hypothetical protein